MKNGIYWMEYLELLAEGQESGEIKHGAAGEMNNTVGKVIAFARVTLEAQKIRQKTKGMKVIPPLEFGQDVEAGEQKR